jgi:hypothetical protein
MQQQQGQSLLTDYLNYPGKQLDYMGKPLGFAQGSQTTIPGNPYASALGGGLLGLQIGGALTGQNQATAPTSGGPSLTGYYPFRW